MVSSKMSRFLRTCVVAQEEDPKQKRIWERKQQHHFLCVKAITH